VGWFIGQGVPQLLLRAHSLARLAIDRPALTGQPSAGKTKVIEEFIAAFGEAVRELSTGHRLAHILDMST
jgi:hypothetical protein